MGKPNVQQVRRVDCTPTWVGILPVILNSYMNGPAHNRDNLETELRRMAEAADNWNTHCKEQSNAHQPD